ncbi:MAG: sigma 54-interacting transcriptional regulator, partial [Burkholderiales bacterium]|nr:sigma 54-interacting transcriptional regulator [Burkholderiales bacterium]
KKPRGLNNGHTPRGGGDAPRRVDVRIIAATNRQLKDSVRDGHFRADLYHRLSVYPVHIPPLRERGSDVLVLAGHFLELNRARLGLRSLRLSPAAEQALCAYHWPGNVRELEHVISRAALKAVSRGASRTEIVSLEPELLDLDMQQEAFAPVAASSMGNGEGGTLRTLREAVEAVQRQSIREALDRCDQNWARAARMLGMDASNLHKLARRLGLK